MDLCRTGNIISRVEGIWGMERSFPMSMLNYEDEATLALIRLLPTPTAGIYAPPGDL